ncbi:hypothetical protein [Nocardiopsis sp. MG754419]|uniref:hypothetical protein n=1 Tax=Nocardiopsis sp. MG754419 TaxID=2259865 RepID=UPI001BA732C1|nr:hypothetical protein [Nocardiopsis sp. MG754419]MBR8741364.1 hypothetical protein [Nocardiopsis sp. MG754419]
MSFLTVVGMLGGLVVVLVTRRARTALARLVVDERDGLIGPREAARVRWEHVRRSFRLWLVVSGALAVVLAATAGRAAVSGGWGGTLTYYAAVFGVLLVVALITLWRAHRDLARARAALDG